MLPAALENRPTLAAHPPIASPDVLPTLPEADDHSAVAHEHIGHDPTPDEIATEAYHLYAARGFQDGFDVEDWLAAEEMLKQRRRI